MKRALVFGGTGMLGRAMAAHWRRHGVAVLALSRAQADITDRARLLEWAARFRPEVVVNCAAFTRVDACEEEVERAMAVNGTAVAHAAVAAESVAADFVQVSTDYVFDGRGYGNGGDGPAPYPEDAPTGPLSVYGRSKLAGEQEALRDPRALVVRTSWLFGPGGPNFVTAVRGRAERGEPLRVVDDQVGCPTYTPYLARAIWELIGADARGLVHFCNRGAVSWYGFAREILGPRVEVARIKSEELRQAAPRPAFSVLALERFEETVGRRAEPWIRGLGDYLETVGERS